MTAAPQPTDQTLTQDLLREILASANDPVVVSVPDDLSPAAFKPRDGVESMLACLAVAHVRLVLKSVNEVLAMPPGPSQSRGQAQLVALDRMLLGYMRELRMARKRPDDSLAATAPDPVPPKATAAQARTARTAPPFGNHRAPFAPPPGAPNKVALLSGASIFASTANQSPPAMSRTIPAAPG